MKQSRLRPDWQVHMADGVRYLETAEGGLERPSVFNHELIYHLTAMAIEHLGIAYRLFEALADTAAADRVLGYAGQHG